MIKAQFIDEDYLYDNTLIERNVDSHKINPMIFKAQDMHIAEALGSDFYNRLMIGTYHYLGVQEPGGPTIDPLLALNADEEELLIDFIQPALAEWTHYMLVAQLRTKFTNKSASQEYSQYSNTAERQDIQDIKSELRDMAEFYTARLIKHLCLNSDLFPLYMNPSDKENLHASSNSYNSGVYFKSRSGKCCNNGSQYKNNN